MTNRTPSMTLVTLAFALGATSLPGLSNAADADSAFAKTHPRREQVNQRLSNQNKRIQNEVASGDLTKAQAAKLHRDDRKIRREERLMASQNGGHHTKDEQRVLNQQENAVSGQIAK